MPRSRLRPGALPALLISVVVLLMTACSRIEEPQAPVSADAVVEVTQPEADTIEAIDMIHPEQWPLQQPPLPHDPAIEARIADLLGRMTVEEKVGQILQADIASVTPEQVREFNLGSVLNGGGSAPKNDLRGRPEDWLALADAFWEASTDTSDGGVGVPVVWGTDAVHGHSNIVGATLFPHNIGLGAANDPDLMEAIGRATALEILTTGLDWTFAPTVAVVRNDRWGRTYESYSEDPRIVAAYAPRIVTGIQGQMGTSEFLDQDHMIACAKHYVGDGGTFEGHDQGDNRASEEDLRDIHAAGYPPAIAAGVQTVMASFNSFHGVKMHGNRAMLNDVLVERMGFDGFVVGDWNGHGQVAGCSNDSCAASFNAGLDLFMVPNDWQALYHNTLDDVRAGVISMERLDQAVARILRVKARAGLLDAPRPSERPHAGDWSLLGAPEHRAIARAAVRQSLVLLKNNGGLLPLSSSARILVTGDGANDIGKQSGGWTLSWQGTGNDNSHFPNGESIFGGIEAAVSAAGGAAELSLDGRWTVKPDAAVVVFGEDPYAEGVGDRPDVDYPAEDGLRLLRGLRAAGIPTVSVFLSGRPLWVNPELNASDAFVAAWLPGSEGGGIADVIIGTPDGKPRHEFTGRLSFSWPAATDQVDVNIGDADYTPLFAYGYGLDYASEAALGQLPEDAGAVAATQVPLQLLVHGKAVAPWRLVARDAEGETGLPDARGASPQGLVSVLPADFERQEDTLIATWTGPGSLVVLGGSLDPGSSTAIPALELRYRVLQPGAGAAGIALGQGSEHRLELSDALNAQAGGDWRTVRIALRCFLGDGEVVASIDEPLHIYADAGLSLQLAEARWLRHAEDAGCVP